MKKPFLILAAIVSLISMAACSGNKTVAPGNMNVKHDQVYTGVIPGADVDGIRYTLKLDYDDDHNYTTGDYDLLETYIKADSTANIGYSDLSSFKSEGDFTVEQKDGKTYLKLVKDARDSSQGSVEGPLYFLVESDSTLVMVNSQLEPAANPQMNYTLKLAK